MNNDVIVTSNEGETRFDFDEWVKENGLLDIRNIFIRHNVTTAEDLSMHSDSFKHFMCDPQLITNYPHLIPVVIPAIQNVSKYISNNKDLNSFVVISEEENAVLESIKSMISTLKSTECELNDYNIKYPQIMERIKSEKLNQIENTEKKVSQTFDKIINALTIKKQIILKKLENIKMDVINNRDNDANECKEGMLLQPSLQKIKIAKQFLSETLETCKNEIKSSKNSDTQTIKTRRNRIINIAKESAEAFSKIENELNENTKKIKHVIDSTNNTEINIDFAVNEATYNKILSKISNVGVIITEKEREVEIKDEDSEQFKSGIISALSFENNHSLNKNYHWYQEMQNDEKESNVNICRSISSNRMLLFCDGSIKLNALNRNLSRKPSNCNKCIQLLKQNSIYMLNGMGFERQLLCL